MCSECGYALYIHLVNNDEWAELFSFRKLIMDQIIAGSCSKMGKYRVVP